jgi:hypothetical protein
MVPRLFIGLVRAAALAALVAAAACASNDAAPTPPPSDAFTQRALAIAGEYTGWGRVDDELRWAPFLCRIPLPGVARMSESSDPATHGRKLYSVFVKRRDAYPAGPQAGDQVVVKESWTAEPVTTPYNPEAVAHQGPNASGNHFYPYARKGDAVYRAGAPAGLYLMFKVDPPTADTDQGWVYATLTPDRRVTAAGRVASCMGCHEHAPHDRLFGVPKSPLESH